MHLVHSAPFVQLGTRSRLMSANTASSFDVDVTKRLFGFSLWSLTLATGRFRSQTRRSNSLVSDIAALDEGGADRGSLLSHGDALNDRVPLAPAASPDNSL